MRLLGLYLLLPVAMMAQNAAPDRSWLAGTWRDATEFSFVNTRNHLPTLIERQRDGAWLPADVWAAGSRAGPDLDLEPPR